jgi:hypothetical protein
VSDQQQTSEYTSFDPALQTKGGTSWGDNKVRIISAKFIWETWKGNGTPSCQLEVKGIALVEDAKERRELYSVSKIAVPTLDGEGVAQKDTVSEAAPFGKPIKINEKSNTGRFFAALHNAGFPFTLIQDPKTGRPQISGLTGAVITFKGEERKGEKGEVKKSENGYTEYSYWPVAYLKDESQQGGGSGAGVTKANGTPVAAAASSGDHEQAAKDLVIELLMNADGNTLKRSDMTKLVPAGTPKEVKLLLLKEPFLKSIDGVSYDKGVLSVA